MTPWITAIPRGWRASTVGMECDVADNLREPINESERAKMRGPYPYYGPTKIVDHLNHWRVEGTYTLVGEDGDHFLKFSELDMTQLVSGRFNVNNHAHLLRGKDGCTTEWLYEYFRRRSLRPFLTRQGAGRYKLTKGSLEQLPILVPPLDEQKRIHEVLLLWDAAIAGTDRLVVAKRSRRKWLMQRLLAGKSRLPGFAGRWSTARMGEVFTNRIETARAELPLLSITGEGGVIERHQVDRKDTSSEDKRLYVHICPGDIGYNTMRMWQGVSGLSAFEGIVSPAYTVITPCRVIDGEFMAIVFKFPPVVNLFRRYSQGLVDDTLNLKYPHFAQIKVTIPEDIEEQRAIARVFRLVDREIALLRDQLVAFKEQKKGLMQLLLTGKRRVDRTCHG